jgi:mono/diheme cytochrome c family protein
VQPRDESGLAARRATPRQNRLRPANYTTKAIAAESDGALFWKLSEGRGAMVPFKSTYSEKQRWELISYIRTLQGKK